MKHVDTIVAPITATGGAVGLIRVSGPDAWRVAASIFSHWPQSPVSHHALHGRFCTGDDGLLLPFEAGRGYTGEEAVELSVHGSQASIDSLVEACRVRGCRLAEPGEFTLRAFMNGKMDLSQAEAVRDTVAAQTALQLRFANAQRDGLLRARVSAIRDAALKLLAAVEASVDFSEEVGDLDRVQAGISASAISSGIEELLATERYGRILRKGLRIALVGEPNAGKSSLLNALLKTDRAIVTPIPGTTRDTIEESVDLAGIPCVLIDTAGLRATDDLVEREGVERARHAMESSDVVWYVHDASLPLPDTLPEHDALVLNKIDLVGAEDPRGICVSAVNGAGLEGLASWVEGFADGGSAEIAIDPRHGPALRRARVAVAEIESCLASDLPDDLLASCLREVIHALGEVTGESADADMLERIFSEFCIGK